MVPSPALDPLGPQAGTGRGPQASECRKERRVRGIPHTRLGGRGLALRRAASGSAHPEAAS